MDIALARALEIKETGKDDRKGSFKLKMSVCSKFLLDFWLRIAIL